ncbi:MAG: hypothetical protein E7680_00730 [Ruminococcaceae bacterium]|nr:hypothetical protein [Oscillospiraceae bacterium]
MEQAKYKIVITFVEAGMGHITSATAIADALEKYHSDEVEVIRTNIFTDTNDKVLIKYQQFLIDEVKRSNKHPAHMFYVSMTRMPLFPRMFSLIFTNATIFHREKKRVMNILRRFDPDMAFHTHFTPTHDSVEAGKKRRGNFLTGFYDPDTSVHGWWDKRADLCIFNNKGAYEEALKLKYDPKKCFWAPFALRQKVLDTPKDKILLRRKRGLPESGFIVTLSSSAYAGGLLLKFANRFLEIDRPFTLLVLAGSNEKVREKLEQRVGHTGKVDLRVYGFDGDAHELYGASDIFVTKAGPNALLDCVYMGTPVMTNFCASQIERKTRAYYIDEQKTGVHIKDENKAAEFLIDCMDDPEKLAPYIENCKRFARELTGGEKMIADAIVEKLRKNGPPKAARNLQKTADKAEEKELLPV